MPPAPNLAASQLSNKKHLCVKSYTGLVCNCQKTILISLPPDLSGDVNPCRHVAFMDQNLQQKSGPEAGVASLSSRVLLLNGILSPNSASARAGSGRAHMPFKRGQGL